MEKKYKFLLIFLGLVMCVANVVLKDKHEQIKLRNQLLENNYKRSFYDTVNYLNDVDNLLAKVQLTKLPKQNINMFAQIWRTATNAHDNLSSLPYSQNLISQTMKYLSQTSDFSYSMMNKSIDNENLTQDEWQKLNDLKNYANKLSTQMDTVLVNANVGQKLNLIDESETDLSDSMQDVTKEFQEYGELIYDGPFSDHIQKIKPKMLEGKNEISQFEAAGVAKKIFSQVNGENINYEGENITRKNMPTYIYTAENGQKIYLEITKNGGYPLLMITTPSEEFLHNKVNVQQAISNAKKFLQQNGFLNMRESYYEKFENNLVINFAATQKGFIMYPDLIKVKINLHSGQIEGFESLGYLSMHCERLFKDFELSPEMLEDLLPAGFNKISTKKCVIPLESKNEAFCYEVVGIYGSDKFIIYVNGDSGKFEKIYRLIENERGVLAE